MALISKEKYSWIKLALSENIGPITFKDLIHYFKTAEDALRQIPEFSRRGGRTRPIKIAADLIVDKQVKAAEKLGASIIISNENDFPFLLRQIEDCPPIIFTLGHKSLLAHKSVSIVGSRNSSINGQNLAKRIAFDLSQADYVVVSGMARGIDSSAHDGALSNTNTKGGTIAVLGTGIDTIYPKENETLYHKIKERGCLVSELPIGTKPFPAAFPRRNRIISGLSIGTLVIEANQLSGSLITAREALSQNREVFAVPGSPVDSRSAGPNQLIKDGAHLVSTAEDILSILDMNTTRQLFDSFAVDSISNTSYQSINEQDLNEARKIILSRLSPEVTAVNQLVRGTGLPTDVVTIILIELELAGRIERFAGQRVALVYNNEWEN